MSILRKKQTTTTIIIIRIIMVLLVVLKSTKSFTASSSKGINRHRMIARPRSTTTNTTTTTTCHLSFLWSKLTSVFALSKDSPSDTTASSCNESHQLENALLRGPAKEAARLKRKRKIGMAKAVDRGMPNVITYNPAKINNEAVTTTTTTNGPIQVQFQALSGLPNRQQKTPFTVLGIESSCDDTGAAVVRSDGVILGEALAKQIEIHNVWGGVVPGLARDAHVQNMDRIIDRAIANAGLKSVDDVDAIAVTVGPGLEICLRVGCQKAVELAQTYNKPFVGVHHLEAHILMARMPYEQTTTQQWTNNNTIDQPQRKKVPTIDFPFLALLVSGGHCQLLECHGIGQYRILGGTIDDSLGEAYDKTARLLGLPVGGGGGPAVEKLAAMGNDQTIRFTVPMHSRKDLDFSYAGLKTNVRRASEKLIEQHNAAATSSEKRIERADQLPEQVRADLAASFQNVAIQHIEQRLKRAMDMLESSTNIRTLAVVGGVAANQKLRSRLEVICSRRNEPWTMVVPPPRLCTDQGAMSAWAGVERLLVGSSDLPSSEVYARYPFAVISSSSDEIRN